MPSNSNPSQSALRLLILAPYQLPAAGASPSPFPPLLTALTSTQPSASLASFAGYTSHPPLRLKTKYYARDVGIWCDELPPVSKAPRRGSQQSSDAAVTAGGSTSGAATDAPSSSTAATSDSAALADPPSSPSKHPIPSESAASPSSGGAKTSAPATDDSNSSQEALSLQDWKAQFLSSAPEVAEVLASIGAIILVLPIPDSPSYPSTPNEKVELMEYITAVNEVKDAIEDLGRDVGSLFVLQPAVPKASSAKDGGGNEKLLHRLEGLAEKFEDKCQEMGVFGWDFVWWDGGTAPPPTTSATGGEGAPAKEKQDSKVVERNQFGEKIGIERVREVLEAVDWNVSPAFVAAGGDGPDDDKKYDVFGGEKFKGLDAELQREMMGLKLSMLDSHDDGDDGVGEEGEDMSIDQMSALMERVVAIREAGADMEKGEREQFAKGEVEKIMHELG